MWPLGECFTCSKSCFIFVVVLFGVKLEEFNYCKEDLHGDGIFWASGKMIL
jgi:hypothetical protein